MYNIVSSAHYLHSKSSCDLVHCSLVQIFHAQPLRVQGRRFTLIEEHLALFLRNDDVSHISHASFVHDICWLSLFGCIFAHVCISVLSGFGHHRFQLSLPSACYIPLGLSVLFGWSYDVPMASCPSFCKTCSRFDHHRLCMLQNKLRQMPLFVTTW